jgi:hypothetical protein
MTQQESVEQNVRLAIGDLTLQLIMARGRIAELEQQLADLSAAPEQEQPVPKMNGKGKEEHPA